MESVISTPRGGAVKPEYAKRGIWRRCSEAINVKRKSQDGTPDPMILLPTYEATDRELRLLAEPVFRERIDQIRTETFTRYVTGGS